MKLEGHVSILSCGEVMRRDCARWDHRRTGSRSFRPHQLRSQRRWCRNQGLSSSGSGREFRQFSTARPAVSEAGTFCERGDVRSKSMGIPGGRYRLASTLFWWYATRRGSRNAGAASIRAGVAVSGTPFSRRTLIDQPDDLLPRRVYLTGAGFRNARALLAVNYRQR